MPGPAFNSSATEIKLNILSGVCDHQTKYGKPCGTMLTLHTWEGVEGVVRCPNCGKLTRVSQKENNE